MSTAEKLLREMLESDDASLEEYKAALIASHRELQETLDRIHRNQAVLGQSSPDSDAIISQIIQDSEMRTQHYQEETARLNTEIEVLRAKLVEA
jgi:hypothetical protein